LHTTLTKLLARSALGIFIAVVSSACVYRINIQQGNYLDQAAVNQVQEGMTRSQVRYLLGTPLAADPFEKDRWDYVYYLKKGRSQHVDSRRVKLDKPSDAVAAAQEKSLTQIKNGRVY